MGVDAVITVENSRHITMDAFVDGMNAAPWGKRYALDYSGGPAWESFEWEGKTYFSLSVGSPRYSRLFKDEWDFDCDKYYPNPRFNYVSQVTFCKAMQTAEALAGGPVYLGNDVVWSRTPSSTYDEEFTLPPDLSVIMEDWRTIAALPITPEELHGRGRL
jgi:hypothetical protein